MDELGKKLTELSEKYGPNVVEATLAAARMEGQHRITAALFGLGAAVALAFLCRQLFKLRLAYKDDMFELFSTLGILFSGLGAAVFFAVSAWTLIDPWTWTALNNPEVFIARKVFKL